MDSMPIDNILPNQQKTGAEDKKQYQLPHESGCIRVVGFQPEQVNASAESLLTVLYHGWIAYIYAIEKAVPSAVARP